MYQSQGIKEGMTVRSIDGHKLGKVYSVGEREFFVEKGIFFPKDYAVRFGEISELRDGDIILAHGKDSLRSFSDSLASNVDLNTRERTRGLSSEDLGVQDMGPYNTEGASASPISTEEDRAMRRRPDVSEVMPMPLGPSFGQAVSQQPVMRASADDDLLPGRSVHTVDEDFEEALRMNQREDDYDEALRINQHRDEDQGNRRGYVLGSDDSSGNFRF